MVDHAASDPAWRAMASDETAHQARIIAAIRAELVAIGRGRCPADANLARAYADTLNRQHAESVPLSMMEVSVRRLAAETGLHRKTIAGRLPEMLEALPDPLRDVAPRPSRRVP